jgi:hypothetical protein
MSYKRYSSALIISLSLLLSIQTMYAADTKFIGFGAYHNKIRSDAADDWIDIGWIPYNGFGTFEYEEFEGSVFALQGWYLGAANWTDENGNLWPIKLTGDGQWSGDELFVVMPVEDERGIQIHRYVRYAPPMVKVDGAVVSDPFPFDIADEVAPEKIPGTAYAMVEFWANTDLGMTLHQRVLQWAHDKHDNYLIYEWTFINTGNTDLDDDIELPGQLVEDLYFSHDDRPTIYHTWMSAYGETYGMTGGDSLRIYYSYPFTSKTSSYDMFGSPQHPGSGFLEYPVSIGVAVLHVDKSGTDKSDWPEQPHVWTMLDCDMPPFLQPPTKMSDTDIILNYDSMVNGFKEWTPWPVPEFEGQWPGGHKSARFDEMGYEDIQDYPISYPTNMSYMAMGPYTVEFGDSITFVLAEAAGNLSPQKAFEVGAAWEAGTADDLWPESEWPGGDYGLPAQFDSDEILGSDHSDDANDLAKDAWVYSSVDSLFNHVAHAQWATQNGYNVPVPPAAPSVDVISGPDRITIEWNGTESELADDFAGYRVYRALGSPDPRFYESSIIGEWKELFECGEGTDNVLTDRYEDMSAVRGQAYYYYVAAFDDGSDTNPDYGRPNGGVSLESGKYLNRSTVPAFLTRAPGESLSDIRVVPNPYNWGARELQFSGQENKIMFMNIPPYCKISIYTMTGDLVKVINHDDGSGDETWGNPQIDFSHSTTSTGQLIASGLYIAHFTVTRDYRDPETDELKFKKGDIKNVKFMVAR